jgi:hypothetical protein
VACHAEPVVHKGRFSTRCVECHSTHTWDGAEFKHAIFPTNHRGSNNRCAACHNEPNNLKSYTCYNCHHHTPAKEVQRHARRIKNLKDLDNCIACHASGMRGRRAEAKAPPAHHVMLDKAPAAMCPAGPSGVGALPRMTAVCPVGRNMPALGSRSFHLDPESGGSSRVNLVAAIMRRLDRSETTTALPTPTGQVPVPGFGRNSPTDVLRPDAAFRKYLFATASESK